MEEDNEMTRTMKYLNSFPEGYRFCPTDRELIIHYLRNKVLNEPLPPNKIRDVDLYSHSPQDLFAMFGEEVDRTMYFFTQRNRKYPNGNRPRRSTGMGFWKATGVDTAIGNKRDPIGFRRALVYYIGKAQDGIKTSWIMHEYRLNQKNPQRSLTDKTVLQNVGAAATRDMKLDDWVLCKVYLNKNSVKKNQRASSSGNRSPPQPPLQCNMTSSGSSVSLPQLTVPNDIGFPHPMPNVVGCSSNSFVSRRQFNMPNNIDSAGSSSPMHADHVVIGSASSTSLMPVVGFSTGPSSPQHQLFNVSNSIGFVDSASPVPSDVISYSTGLMPQRQFNVPNDIGSISYAPPMQTTYYSSNNIQQDQPLYSEYLQSSLREYDENSLGDFRLPFDDDIKDPSNIG